MDASGQVYFDQLKNIPDEDTQRLLKAEMEQKLREMEQKLEGVREDAHDEQVRSKGKERVDSILDALRADGFGGAGWPD